MIQIGFSWIFSINSMKEIFSLLYLIAPQGKNSMPGCGFEDTLTAKILFLLFKMGGRAEYSGSPQSVTRQKKTCRRDEKIKDPFGMPAFIHRISQSVNKDGRRGKQQEGCLIFQSKWSRELRQIIRVGWLLAAMHFPEHQSKENGKNSQCNGGCRDTHQEKVSRK